MGNRRKSHRDPDTYGLLAGCKSLVCRREKADRIVEFRGWVLPLTTVDNSDLAPTRLTAQMALLMISQLFLPHLSNSEDRYGLSCVRVPARRLPPALSGAAGASLLVPSSAFLLTRGSQAQQAPPSTQASLPRRLPGLSSRFPCLVGWRASTWACTPLARGQKPPWREPRLGKR